MPSISPLAPAEFPAVHRVPGVRIGAASAGIRYRDRDDLMMAALAPGTVAAGVFTRSAVPGPPVLWSREILERDARDNGAGLVVNAGVANVFTGKAGRDAVRITAETAAALIGCAPTDVFIASTGVIGEPLPVDAVTDALPALYETLDDDAWLAAANAIRTTDTFAKAASRTARIGETTVTISGIAKGSGMIAPDMATMLAFVFTDAALTQDVLQACLAEGADRSFNCITVDGDTSTSDTVLLFATGRAGNAAVGSVDDPELVPFRTALEDLMVDLAQQIVRDGEGASKFITVTVTGAESEGAAKRIAMSVANSPLVKTAIAGEDANWGRIVMAVGKAGETVDPDHLTIRVGGQMLTEEAAPAPDFDEAVLSRHLGGREIDIAIDLGIGAGQATVWTCDLTHGYIDINAHYRT